MEASSVSQGCAERNQNCTFGTSMSRWRMVPTRIGAKPPLRQKHVWAIRTMLQVERSTRDLAMFNLAIDSKLRGCDVVAIRVDDIAPNGYAIDRATVRQRKTGRPVRFELTEHTRQAIDDYLKVSRKKPGEFLFSAPQSERSMTPRQYGRLVSDWFAGVG